MNKITFVLILVFSINVGAKQKNEIDNSSNTSLNEPLSSLYDKNLDGVKDVFYEYQDDGSYYELNDSNYDGKIDQNCKYDSNDTVVNCGLDQDFNGYVDSRIEYYLGMVLKEGIDSNHDEVYEIVFHYESGILAKGFKFYSKEGKSNQIGQVNFKFGYPSKETLTNTDLSLKEFSNKYWRDKTHN